MSANFFAALDDSGDEAPAIAKTNAKKREPKANKKGAPAPSGDGAPVPAAASGGALNQGGKPAGRGARPAQNDRNTKSGRGGRAPTRDGKRAYDRRSGTGRGKEIKKDGGGARNWGSEKEDAKKMEGKVIEEDVNVKEEKPVVVPVVVAAAEGETPQVEAPAEPAPEDNTQTYAEYMAAKGKTEAAKMREVDNEFKGLVAAKMVEEDFLVMGGNKAKKTKKKKDEKKTIEVGFRTAKPDTGERDDREREGGRGRGGRGGRGGRDGRGGRGGRDGRGRGRGRGVAAGGGGGRGGKPTGLNVQDEAAFPSL